MPISLFEIKTSELASLPSDTAVLALRDILLFHARKLGIPYTAVNIPGAINVRDGGVDADIHCPAGIIISGDVVFGGLTCYQVKTGGFKASTLRDIKSILLRPSSVGKSKPIAADLNDRVKACLDSNGTFVIALFGSDSVDRTENATVNKFRSFLKRIDVVYENAKIIVWRANQIAALVSEISGTSLELKGISSLKPFAHDWGWMEKSCGFLGRVFLETEKHVGAMDGIRTAARGPEPFSHIRVLGEPGCGKTRLVFEALRAQDLIPLVVYCVDGSQILENGVLEVLKEQARFVPMILVIDECDSIASFHAQQLLKSVTKNMTLVTIYNETVAADRSDQEISLIDAPILSVEQVAVVIESYGVPADRAEIVAQLCDGSPRVAHGVGASMRRESGGAAIVELDSLSRIWDSYIAGRDGTSHADYRDRLLILTCLALFKKFGWTGTHSDEAHVILERLIQRIEPSISWAKFRDAVEHFRARRVLQGTTTLYLTPRLLHIKLWVDWWNFHSGAIDLLAVLQELPRELQEWVQSMFVYARESSAANEVVSRILDPGGPYASLGGFMSRSASSMFFTVAQVNPRAAAHRILTALKSSSRDELLLFNDGRRSVVHALEHIAVFEDCFLDAAYCLMRLAEAENETWSNNASGVFADLFSLGFGPIASTEMPPHERLPFLESHIESALPARRHLILKAFESALRWSTTRTSLGETHGLRPLPQRWTPTTWGEIFDVHLLYLEALYRSIPQLTEPEAKIAAKIITDNSRSLIRMRTVAARLLTILEQLARRGSDALSSVVEAIVSILHFERKDADATILSELQDLYDRLVGESFEGRLLRYVSLDLIEDKFNERGEHEDQAELAMRPLASDALSNPTLLIAQLPWLVTEQAKNGYTFGRLLGLLDTDLSVWNEIKAAWISAEFASDFLIGGYLSGVFQSNQRMWEAALREIADAPELVSRFPTLLWRSGMSAEMAELLLTVMREKQVSLTHLRMFLYGAVVRQIPRTVMMQFFEMLIVDGGRKTAEVAVELLASIYRREMPDPEDMSGIAMRILGNDALFGGDSSVRSDNMLDFYWKEAAMKLLDEKPALALELAKKVIEHFGVSGSIFGAFQPSSLEFLDMCVTKFTEPMWDSISKFLQPPMDGRAYKLFQWLRGDERPGRGKVATTFSKFPQNLVLNWVSGDVDKRALAIAHFVPPTIGGEDFKESLARSILLKYGARKSVRSAFHANYNTGMWWGSSAQHHRDKRAKLRALLASEDSQNVRRWINEELSSLELQIKADDEDEERDDL